MKVSWLKHRKNYNKLRKESPTLQPWVAHLEIAYLPRCRKSNTYSYWI